jgi:hypothetical protein
MQEEFLKMTPKEADQWLRTQEGQLGYRYKEFFKRHGHRGMREVIFSFMNFIILEFVTVLLYSY